MARPYYVYAIGVNGEWGGLERAIKIGVGYDPKRRLYSCQTGCPAELEIRRTWKFKDEVSAREFEKACHRRFKDRQSLREWFFVAVSEVEEFRAAHDDILRAEYEEQERAIARARDKRMAPIRELAQMRKAELEKQLSGFADRVMLAQRKEADI